jgi:hypothetical protein
MSTVERSRVVLLLSLVVLGGSLAAFAGATGAASLLVPGADHEVVLEDGALHLVADGQERTLLRDVRTAERIEVRTVDGTLLVTAEPRHSPALSETKRRRAKRIATRTEPLAGVVRASGGTLFAIRPIPRTLSSDRAAVAGADPETDWPPPVSLNDSSFTVREPSDGDGAVIERVESPVSDRRALVVVDANGGDARYSAVVDLRRQSVEAFVRLDATGR